MRNKIPGFRFTIPRMGDFLSRVRTAFGRALGRGATLSGDMSARFDARMDALLPRGARSFAVALSGGSDSMALALLAKGYADAHGLAIVALTIDHGLRPDSAAEAGKVHGCMAARAIPHEILRRGWRVPTSNIEAAAREYRYRLLLGYCRRHGIPCLLVAHTRDEQAETFFLNLSRGSGVYGLAGMAEASRREGVAILRPMLSFSKDEIKACLRRSSQEWFEDPSNADTRYKRVRIRRMRRLLGELELGPERISATIANMARARDALEFFAAALEKKLVSVRAPDSLVLDPSALRGVPEETAIRALGNVIREFSGAAYAPRFESLEALYRALAVHGRFAGSTLSRLRFSKAPGGMVWVSRETGRRTPGKKTAGKKR